MFFFFFNLFFWLWWVLVSVRGLSPVVASGGHSSSQCAGLSPWQPLSLRSTGSRRAGSAVVAHSLSCSVARGIFPDQGSNPCPLHWQADSQPLRHQGSPPICVLIKQVNILEHHPAGELWEQLKNMHLVIFHLGCKGTSVLSASLIDSHLLSVIH